MAGLPKGHFKKGLQRMPKELVNLAIFLTFFSVFACKQTDSSETKATLARPDTVGVVQCNDSRHGMQRPVTKKYLRNLLNSIAAASPETFKGDLIAENFCIGSQINELNAYALSYDRSINFGRDLLLKANSDSEIMAVLSHEIAHVILRHDMGGTRNIQDQIAVSERERTLISKRTQLNRDVTSYRAALTAEAEQVAELLRCSFGRDKKIEGIFDLFSEGKSESKPLTTGINSLLPSPSSLISKSRNFTAKTMVDAGVFIEQHRFFVQSKRPTVHEQSIETSSDQFKDILEKMQSVGCGTTTVKSLRTASSKFEESIDKLNSQIEQVTQQIGVLNTHGMNQQESVNWKESEADDVGFQLYNNTGLVSYGFTWIYALTGAKKADMDTENEGDNNFVNQMAVHCSLKGDVDRGMRSHPSACWRILNVLTKQRNKALISGNLGNLPVETVFSKNPTLQQVHAELRR